MDQSPRKCDSTGAFKMTIALGSLDFRAIDGAKMLKVEV